MFYVFLFILYTVSGGCFNVHLKYIGRSQAILIANDNTMLLCNSTITLQNGKGECKTGDVSISVTQTKWRAYINNAYTKWIRFSEFGDYIDNNGKRRKIKISQYNCDGAIQTSFSNSTLNTFDSSSNTFSEFFTETPLSAEEQTSLSAEEQTPLSAEEQTPLSAEEQTSLSAEEQTPLSAEEQTPLSAEEQTSLSAEEQTPLSVGNNKRAVLPAKLWTFPDPTNVVAEDAKLWDYNARTFRLI